MVGTYQRFSVTEPRDRVYDLLGILEEFDNAIRLPCINYSIPLVELFWMIIKSHIEVTENLQFLTTALGPKRPSGVPSWMPYRYDGYKSKDRACSVLNMELAPDITYKATAATLPFCYFNPRLKALRIAGFCSAKVQQLGEAVDLSELTDATQRLNRKMQSNMQAALLPNGWPYLTLLM